MADLNFKTKLDFGNIGCNKRLTYTAWNDGDYKFDIRDWYEKGGCGKGITLTKTELKALYDILVSMESNEDEPEVKEELDEIFGVDDKVEEPEDDATEEQVFEAVDDDNVFGDDEEEIEKYPTKVQKIFDKLDKVFKGFKVEKAYGVMPFATESGNRLQYCVKADEKDFPEVEDVITKLDLRWFLTDKGNLYIYTLGE